MCVGITFTLIHSDPVYRCNLGLSGTRAPATEARREMARVRLPSGGRTALDPFRASKNPRLHPNREPAQILISNADRVLADRRPSASRRRPLRPRRRHAVLATTARSQRHSHRSHAHDDASTRGICETKESPTIATIAVRHHCGCSHPKDKSRARKTSLLLPQQKPARACWRPRTVEHGDERPKFVGGSTICSRVRFVRQRRSLMSRSKQHCVSARPCHQVAFDSYRYGRPD